MLAIARKIKSPGHMPVPGYFVWFGVQSAPKTQMRRKSRLSRAMKSRFRATNELFLRSFRLTAILVVAAVLLNVINEGILLSLHNRKVSVVYMIVILINLVIVLLVVSGRPRVSDYGALGASELLKAFQKLAEFTRKVAAVASLGIASFASMFLYMAGLNRWIDYHYPHGDFGKILSWFANATISGALGNAAYAFLVKLLGRPKAGLRVRSREQ